MCSVTKFHIFIFQFLIIRMVFMKSFLLSFLLKLYKPQIIAVFGRYGREEARTMIAAVLGGGGDVGDAAAA